MEKIKQDFAKKFVKKQNHHKHHNHVSKPDKQVSNLISEAMSMAPPFVLEPTVIKEEK